MTFAARVASSSEMLLPTRSSLNVAGSASSSWISQTSSGKMPSINVLQAESVFLSVLSLNKATAAIFEFDLLLQRLEARTTSPSPVHLLHKQQHPPFTSVCRETSLHNFRSIEIKQESIL
ncbi:uncharacterized protein V6R79_003833 [Siganus canaliculatus]